MNLSFDNCDYQDKYLHLEHSGAKYVSQEGKSHAGRPIHQGQYLHQRANSGVRDIVARQDVVLTNRGYNSDNSPVPDLECDGCETVDG